MKLHPGIIPALRFPEFDGEWKRITLGDAVNFENGKAHENEIVEDGRFIVVNSKFISSGGRIKKYSHRQISPLFKDDVVMVMSDVPKGQALARCFYIEEDSLYTLNQRICALRVNRYDSKFLFYLVDRNTYFLAFDSGVGQTNLRKDEVLGCPLIVPESKAEQEKIGAFLSVVDKKIRQVARKKELLLSYKRGVMQQIFNQKIRFKDDNDNYFPDWDDIPFHDIARLRKEKFDAATRESRKCVELEQLDQGTGKLLGAIDSTHQSSIKNVFRNGDILFGKLRPYLKKYWHATFDGVCSTEIWVMRPSSEYLSSFLFYLMQSAAFLQAVNISSGSKMPRAEWDVVAKHIFSVPTDEKEQFKISAFLSALDEKIELVGLQLELTKNFKKGLLQQMFV